MVLAIFNFQFTKEIPIKSKSRCSHRLLPANSKIKERFLSIKGSTKIISFAPIQG